ncbi:uncharacterized protein LOC112632376 [Theropithecus gelada]|uniref:uncharacterized protein LOC112632376 n=1 Tax=Theropithecus gelada TaxID=9565 RepID=UPI000DC1825C|nr:uncharacterized protein LOC112632376 [Theropithecus gelada]
MYFFSWTGVPRCLRALQFVNGKKHHLHRMATKQPYSDGGLTTLPRVVTNSRNSAPTLASQSAGITGCVTEDIVAVLVWQHLDNCGVGGVNSLPHFTCQGPPALLKDNDLVPTQAESTAFLRVFTSSAVEDLCSFLLSYH